MKKIDKQFNSIRKGFTSNYRTGFKKNNFYAVRQSYLGRFWAWVNHRKTTKSLVFPKIQTLLPQFSTKQKKDLAKAIDKRAISLSKRLTGCRGFWNKMFGTAQKIRAVIKELGVLEDAIRKTIPEPPPPKVPSPPPPERTDPKPIVIVARSKSDWEALLKQSKEEVRKLRLVGDFRWVSPYIIEQTLQFANVSTLTIGLRSCTGSLDAIAENHRVQTLTLTNIGTAFNEVLFKKPNPFVETLKIKKGKAPIHPALKKQNQRFTYADFKQLKNLKNLKTLYLHCPIKDEDLKKIIDHLPNLQHLEIRSKHLTIGGLDCLKKRDLVLRIACKKISKADLLRFGKEPKITVSFPDDK